jgi:hypothetical protein
MPLELGMALYRSHTTNGRHRVFVFEKKAYRTLRSTSDINGIDVQIHKGRAKGVPEMLASYRAVKRRLPELRQNAGIPSLFEASIFSDLIVAALVERERIIKLRA